MVISKECPFLVFNTGMFFHQSKKWWYQSLNNIESDPGADPGFPVGGGANPPGGGAPTYDFAKFCEKLHEIENILGCGGGATMFYLIINQLADSENGY